MIQESYRTLKLGPPSKKTMGSKAARVRDALDKREDPLSEEEIHFIRTCCKILKIDEKQKVVSIGATAMWEGKEKVMGTISAICHPDVTGALGNEAK